MTKSCEGRIPHIVQNSQQEVSKFMEKHAKQSVDPSGGLKNVEEQLKELAMGMTEQQTEYEQIRRYCDGVGKMLTPLREQIEGLKVTVQEMKDGSGVASLSHCSPDRDMNRGPSSELQNITNEAMKEVQEKLTVLEEDLRIEFKDHFEKGDKNRNVSSTCI